MVEIIQGWDATECPIPAGVPVAAWQPTLADPIGGDRPVLHSQLLDGIESSQVRLTVLTKKDMEVDGFILVPRPGEECSSTAALHYHQDDGSLEYLSEIDTFIDGLEESLWPLNYFIHQNPELAFQEYKAHQALTDFLRSREEGWKVIPSAYGMETAWVAAYDSGKPGPVVSFNVEMGKDESRTKFPLQYG